MNLVLDGTLNRILDPDLHLNLGLDRNLALDLDLGLDLNLGLYPGCLVPGAFLGPSWEHPWAIWDNNENGNVWVVSWVGFGAPCTRCKFKRFQRPLMWNRMLSAAPGVTKCTFSPRVGLWCVWLRLVHSSAPNGWVVVGHFYWVGADPLQWPLLVISLPRLRLYRETLSKNR